MISRCAAIGNTTPADTAGIRLAIEYGRRHIMVFKRRNREEELTLYDCMFCRKQRMHSVSRDGIMIYYTCTVCGTSVELADRRR